MHFDRQLHLNLVFNSSFKLKSLYFSD